MCVQHHFKGTLTTPPSIPTNMEAELSTVVVVGQTEVGCGGSPEGARAVRVSLVLLEQLEVLQEEDTLTDHCYPNLLQMGFLCA